MSVNVFPGPLFPPSLFPGSVFAKPPVQVGPSPAGNYVAIYPGSLFPGSLFPGPLYPGSKPATANPFEVDLLAYLAGRGIVAYPGHVPQSVGQAPACTFALVSGEPRYTTRSAAGLRAVSYQFNCFSPRAIDAYNMERSLWSALGGYRGTMGTTLVTSCRLENLLDLPYAEAVDASDDGTYQRACEYKFFVKETVPTF